MKLPSAPLEASPEAISDDAEHQKDGYLEEGQRREHRGNPADINVHMVGNDSSPPNLGGDTSSPPPQCLAFLVFPAHPIECCRLTIARRRYCPNSGSAYTLASPRERPFRKSFADRSTLVHKRGSPMGPPYSFRRLANGAKNPNKSMR